MTAPITHTGVLPDGTNVMVTRYPDGAMCVATRADSWATWGAPTWLVGGPTPRKPYGGTIPSQRSAG